VGDCSSATRLGEYTNLNWSYRLEQYTIDNIDDDAEQGHQRHRRRQLGEFLLHIHQA
jgi:hypothetical protein